MNKKFLLDTHVWIWMINNSENFSVTVKKDIQKAAEHSLLFLSTISIWELAMLVKKERLHLDRPIQLWVETALNNTGINLIDLLPEIAIDSSFLPGSFHGDPADRIIVATARIHELNLITADKKILEYGHQNYLSAFSPN